jgi:hypothetical protein
MRQEPAQNGDSAEGCGVLSQAAAVRTVAARGARTLRAAMFGALLVASVGTFALGCAGDDNNATGTGSGGSGGAGGSGGGSGGSSGAGGGADEDGSTSCAVATDVDTYSANLMKKGRNGKYTFVLVESDPGPPAKNMNVWKVKVTGPDGMPPDLKQLAVEISMPAHKHNSSIPPTVTFDAASGTFTVDPVYLQMGGRWRIFFEVRDPNDPALPLDSVEFFFCVS